MERGVANVVSLGLSEFADGVPFYTGEIDTQAVTVDSEGDTECAEGR